MNIFTTEKYDLFFLAHPHGRSAGSRNLKFRQEISKTYKILFKIDIKLRCS